VKETSKISSSIAGIDSNPKPQFRNLEKEKKQSYFMHFGLLNEWSPTCRIDVFFLHTLSLFLISTITMVDIKANKKKPVSADDFEDDFQDDGAFIFSDNEAAFSDNEESSTVAVKRKEAPESEEPAKKKKKKQPKKKKGPTNPFDTINIWEEDISTQAAYLVDRQKLALPNLSTVELEEQELPEASLVNNANFKQEHVLDALTNYVKFGVAGHKKLAKKPTVLASPVALIVTHSAVRAVDLVR
jgi:protein CMS1